MKTRRLIFAVAAMAGLMGASTIDCSSPQITNVATSLGVGTGNACAVAGDPSVLFSDFSVSVVGMTSAVVGITGASIINGNDILLTFGLAPHFSTVNWGDILLSYIVSGGIRGVDLHLQASGTGVVEVSEVACGAPFPCTNANTLANLLVVSANGQADSAQHQFALNNKVYVQKDISYQGAFTSSLDNSHLIPSIPEPAALSFVGLGLLALGFLGRKVGR